MAEITIRGGHRVQVDDADLPLLSSFRWYLKKRNDGRGYDQPYVVGDIYTAEGRVRVRMHRIILAATPEQFCDHINGDTLDNRRCNLRIATRQENARNRGKLKRSPTSPWKGVKRAPRPRTTWDGIDRWIAMIKLDGRQVVVGVYETPEIAARAYDDAARKYFQEFARPNFPTAEETARLGPASA